MEKTSHIRLFQMRGLFAAACLALFMALLPSRGFALCEPYGIAAASAATIASQESSYLAGTIVPNIENGWDADLLPLRAELDKDGEANRKAVLSKLNSYWDGWMDAWKGMAAQLSASAVTQSRQFGSFQDADNTLAAARDEEEQRVKATKRYQPTIAACRFDTTANAMSPSRKMSTALQNGYEWDFVQLGNNEKGSAAQDGPAEEQDYIWYNYSNIFCDYRAENGNAGCSTTVKPPPPSPYPIKNTSTYTPTLHDTTKPGYAVLPGGWFTSRSRNDENLQMYANMDAEPSLLLFAQYTIDMFNTTELAAVNQMIFNVTGYEIPPPMVAPAMQSYSGMEQTLQRRRYITQMGTVGALLYSLISDRAPGPPAENIYLARTQEYGAVANQDASKFLKCSWWTFIWNPLKCLDSVKGLAYESQKGTPPVNMLEASLTPSQREIRQSIIEQLWDPKYYKDLYDNPSTIMQKDVYLKAYSLVLLYDMIERQEKISDAYAVETANILAENRAMLAPTSSAPVQ